MTYNGYNDAKKRANNKYRSEKVDSATIYFPKGMKDDLKEMAAQHNLSLNAIVNKAADYILNHPEILDDSEE